MDHKPVEAVLANPDNRLEMLFLQRGTYIAGITAIMSPLWVNLDRTSYPQSRTIIERFND